jgi:tryptophan 7-halogenase
MIKNVIVLGGGSAGFVAAIALKRKLPSLQVRVVRSKDIGVIGVGEGTTQLFPKFFFQQLGLTPAAFYSGAEPTWKLGIRFLWGPRKHFHYSFSNTLESRYTSLQRNTGFYCDGEFSSPDLWYALMENDRAIPRNEHGKPEFFQHAHIAFHVENKKLVDFFEHAARNLGVEIQDATVEHVKRGPNGVEALVLPGGEELTADLFVDASGFRSELLGRTLEVPFKSYTDTLFCERAVIGAWDRTDEPIKPYTTAETMDHGWCWQIEHENFINRGYVYSSRFVDDDSALAEYLRKNPRADPSKTRIVKFRSGRFQTMWQDNVVGIGNSAGFVEPLEASSLQVIIIQSRTLADCLGESQFEPTPSVKALYNRVLTESWDDVRDFLGVHYKFNTRLETPFWKTCRAEIPLHGAQGVYDFYVENGPVALAKNYALSPQNPYGIEGYFALFLGQKVPHRPVKQFHAGELDTWRKTRDQFAAAGRNGFTVREALDTIRNPAWKWS